MIKTDCQQRSVASFLVAFVLLAGGCVKQPEATGQPYAFVTVRDLGEFPQDLDYFAAKAGRSVLLLSPAGSTAQSERYRRLFFSAWSADSPGQGHADFFRAEINRSGPDLGYAENLQPWNDIRWQGINANADMARFPSLRQNGITVRESSFRLAPTELPRFSNPGAPGQGYPFDMIQQSSLPVGFPLVIMHISLDRAWYYAESALASGWIAAKDTAIVDSDFMETWLGLPLAAIVQDNIALCDESGLHLSQAKIGCLLPYAWQDDLSVGLLAPVRNSNGFAEIGRARVSKREAEPFPLALTPGNMAALGNQMMGQSYGWGGLYQDRDCSAMTRDLFTPFGLWLPRNSAAQANAGEIVNLADFGADKKERQILSLGVPFLSLLWLRGHIGLYVGEHQGQAAFFHNIWGIRIIDDGREARHILGRAVVTSTRPGKELRGVEKERLLLNRMEKLTILGRS